LRTQHYLHNSRGGLIDVLVGKKKEKLYVYLFTDILLLTKAKVLIHPKSFSPGIPASSLLNALLRVGGLFLLLAAVGENAGAWCCPSQIQT
jgi:hypothetical protein